MKLIDADNLIELAKNCCKDENSCISASLDKNCKFCRIDFFIKALQCAPTLEKNFDVTPIFRKKENAQPNRCKYISDDFDERCVNAECPMVTEWCPVVDFPGVCRYEDRGDSKT